MPQPDVGLIGFYRGGPLSGPSDARGGYADQARGLLGPGSYGTAAQNMSGQQRGPLGYYSDLAYKLAGSPSPTPTQQIPVGPFPLDMGGGGGGGGNSLDTLQNAKKGYDAYQKYSGQGSGFSLPLNQSAGQAFGTSASSALGANAAGAVPLFGAGAADLGTIGAGALFGTSGAAATGATAAGALPLFGAGATDLGAVGAGELFGTSANAALGSGAATGAGTGAAGAGASSALGTLGAGAGYAALAIGAGKIIHNQVNARGDEKRNMAAYSQTYGVKPVTMKFGHGAANYYELPDGRLLSTGDYEKLSGAWYGATIAPDGNQADWQSKYDDLNASLKSATLPKGAVRL